MEKSVIMNLNWQIFLNLNLLGLGFARKWLKYVKMPFLRDLSFLAGLAAHFHFNFLNLVVFVLDLPDNELTSVNFLRKSGFETLTNISFSNNRIQRIETNTFGRLKNLRELVLSNNKLQSLDYQAFDNLENLRTLDLSNNRILYLQGAQFEGQMPQLIKLDLRGNNLQSVHAAAFKGLDVLLELDLSENRLTSVSFDVFQPFMRRVVRIMVCVTN